MSQDQNSSQKTGPQKLASVLDFVVRFCAPIQIFVFIALAGVLRRFLAAPIADAIAAFLVVLPSYWLIPQRRIGYAAYVVFCAILAACLATIEHLLIR
jgi:hypothetical protein